jgi:hypothetical protein
LIIVLLCLLWHRSAGHLFSAVRVGLGFSRPSCSRAMKNHLRQYKADADSLTHSTRHPGGQLYAQSSSVCISGTSH